MFVDVWEDAPSGGGPPMVDELSTMVIAATRPVKDSTDRLRQTDRARLAVSEYARGIRNSARSAVNRPAPPSPKGIVLQVMGCFRLLSRPIAG
jgi:hypothetical protein